MRDPASKNVTHLSRHHNRWSRANQQKFCQQTRESSNTSFSRNSGRPRVIQQQVKAVSEKQSRLHSIQDHPRYCSDREKKVGCIVPTAHYKDDVRHGRKQTFPFGHSLYGFCSERIIASSCSRNCSQRCYRKQSSFGV